MTFHACGQYLPTSPSSASDSHRFPAERCACESSDSLYRCSRCCVVSSPGRAGGWPRASTASLLLLAALSRQFWSSLPTVVGVCLGHPVISRPFRWQYLSVSTPVTAQMPIVWSCSLRPDSWRSSLWVLVDSHASWSLRWQMHWSQCSDVRRGHSWHSQLAIVLDSSLNKAEKEIDEHR